MFLKQPAKSLALYTVTFFAFMYICKWSLSTPKTEELVSPTPHVTCLVITRNSQTNTSCWKNPAPITQNPGTWQLHMASPYEL